MAITFSCPNCRRSLTRPDTDAGIKIFCSSCHQKLRVPIPPRQNDKTMLGELQTPENRTVLGELATPPTAIASPLHCICPQCQTVIAADPRHAGTRTVCPGCGCAIELPLLQAELVQDVSRVSSVSPTAQIAPARFSFDDTNDAATRARVRAHRGTTLLVLGILSILTGLLIPLVGLGFGIPAWVMGNGDLAGMRARQIDSSGSGLTQAGRICGIVGTCLSCVCCVGYAVLLSAH